MAPSGDVGSVRMRVLITGMGGELGTRVAALVEADPDVEAVLGVDLDPPRRRLHRAAFELVEPDDRAGTIRRVVDFAPTVVVHLGIYEPNARTGPQRAVALTASGTVGLLTAVAEAGSVEHLVIRSGIEVYGRRRRAPVRPDEDVAPDPTSPFGQSLRHVEHVATTTGRRLDVPTTVLRFAPLVGPHFPSPLGRLLRLPTVPVSGLGDPPFSVLHQEDAAAAVVAAVTRPHDGALNVVAPGAVTAAQAARLGGRLALPVVGLGWRPVRLLAGLVGAPLPEHVRELLVRGRTADGSRIGEVLGVHPARTTPEVVEHLYDWPAVTYVSPTDAVEDVA